MTASKGPDGDIERQAEIDSLPEFVTIEVNGLEVEIPYRAAAQQADDEWRMFRDSSIGQAMLNTDLNIETNP